MNPPQVRKTSQAALLVLLEQGLVERSDVQQQVCPVIIELIEAEDHDDYRTEAVAVRKKRSCFSLPYTIAAARQLF